MKRIVILINSLEGGGAERVVSTLLNNFIEEYECYLILMENKIYYELDARINIINLNESSNQNGLVKLIRLPIIAYKLSKIIKKYKFTQIISLLYRANYVNVLAKLVSKHKVIISERSMPSKKYESNTLQSRINKFFIKKLYLKADVITSNSHGNKKDLILNFGIKNVEILQNPFDIKKIEKLSFEKINIKKEKFTFITIGRLNHGKNHKIIIDAIKSLDVNLWIIGDGDLKEYLSNYINELNLNDKVILLGKRDNPFAFLSKADCFVFASSHEGFPNVLVEALACELPIISTDCLSGPREILAPNSDINFQLKNNVELAEYGILTPINNVDKLKEAMNLIINDNNLKNEYRQKAKNRANDFEIKKIKKKYEEIICAE